MNEKMVVQQVKSRMALADPAVCITEDELARSRERSRMAIHSAPIEASDFEQDAMMTSREPLSPVSTLAARRSRRARTWLTVAAAAAVTTALIAGDVVGLAGWRGGATAEASEVLNTAAQTAITTTDPLVNPGQYLRIESTNVWMTETFAHDGATYQWLETEESDMYIPADPTDEWVWERSGRVPTTFFDTKAQDYVREQNTQAHPELLRAPNGEFYGDPGGWAPDISSLPRDPYRLLNNIYKLTLGQGRSVDGQAFVFIADLLRTGVVPADLRAALYEAAAMIPGVTVTEAQANLDGRTGVAIGHTESSGVTGRQEIIIDPETGQLIGEREVLTQDYGAIPAGTAVTWTAIETSVSNTAP